MNIENITESWNKHSGKEVEDFIKDLLGKFDIIEDHSVYNIDIEEYDSDNNLLKLLNEKGGIIALKTIPKGGGDSIEDRITLTANTTRPYVRIGTSASVSYTFELYSGGNITQDNGTVTITIQRGSTILDTITDTIVSGSTKTLNLNNYLDVSGVIECRFKVTAINGEGLEISKNAYVKINVVDLSISTTFNPATTTLDPSNNSLSISARVTGGSGERSIYFYVDGELEDTYIYRSNNSSFTHQFNVLNLSQGKHNIQLVAENNGIRSNSIYIDFFVGTPEAPYIGVIINYNNGTIYQNGPELTAYLFTPLSFDITAWSPNSLSTPISVITNGNYGETLNISRGSKVTYTTLFNSYGEVELILESGTQLYVIPITVVLGDTDVQEEEADLILKLSPSGRSNSELHPDTWGEDSTFTDVDFRNNGWIIGKDGGTSLVLTNGAKVVTGCKPFELVDALQTGFTLEVEFKVTNIMDKNIPLIYCGQTISVENPETHETDENWKGINISAELASCYTGIVKKISTPDSEEDSKLSEGVEMKFASEMWMKVAFVIHSILDERLMELYINGVRSKADVYSSGVSWNLRPSTGITFDSRGADLEIRNVRIYKRALLDHEILSNYIVDRLSIEEMRIIYENNQVLGDQGKVDVQKLRSKGKGVFIFVRPNKLTDINTNNKKSDDFIVDKAYWYSPYGSEYDFVATNFNFRIQGTSSINYPRKNYRIYLNKSVSGTPTLEVGGVVKSNNKYAMRPTSMEKNIFCLKCDFSDSSMVMNTGGAKLFDKVMRLLDYKYKNDNHRYLTPPQLHQEELNQEITVRLAIDGIPCDVFVQSEDNGDAEYIGQYNFNNEKSKSDDLFGMSMENIYSDANHPICPIALEGLNNSNPLCLFLAPKTNLEDWLLEYFDNGFEFNYPEDVFYNQSSIKDSNKERLATSIEKDAIRRLMQWIADMTPNNADYNDISTFVNEDFASEVSNYFNVDHLLTYYLITEYWGSVDLRAKNILWRTWDGLIWYPTFYDGDTAMGGRNDSFLVYNYDITRDTIDVERNKYAYEGHNSNLWCLVLANLQPELRSCAERLRSVLTIDEMNNMFTKEQQQNWCETIYNKSGEYKYIEPKNNGVHTHLYALTGNRESHRTLFLRERGLMLDARYIAGEYYTDSQSAVMKFVTQDDNAYVKITSSGRYSYGYKRANGDWIVIPTEVNDGELVILPIQSGLAVNDPCRIYGSPHIETLDLTGCASELSGEEELFTCVRMRKLDFALPSGKSPSSGVSLDVAGCKVLEEIDITGQTGTTFKGLNTLTRLRIFKAGGATNIVSPEFAPGAPIEQLVLPNTLLTLVLREFRHLTEEGLVLQGTSNITRVIISECPHINPINIIGRCANVTSMRLDGLSGIMSLTTLLDLMNRHISGFTSPDATTEVFDKCPCTGEVWLDRVATPTELNNLRQYFEGLTINQCQYSHYWYDDTELDPANITNEDNKTGYYYYDANTFEVPPGSNLTKEEYLASHPNGYVASGHISLLHDLCLPCIGYINQNNKMEITYLNKENYSYDINGNNVYSILTGGDDNKDIFVYFPTYWYKGVNDYKTQTKHFFLSSLEECPRNFYETEIKTLDQLTKFTQKRISANQDLIQMIGVSDLVEGATNDVYKVDVSGYVQVRFPSIKSDINSFVFTDENGTIVDRGCLNMLDFSMTVTEDNETKYFISRFDFDAEMGSYDFRTIPNNAKYLWFTTTNAFENYIDTPIVVLTTSPDIEAIEPEWVEHKPELVGAYVGSFLTADDVALTGMKSVDGGNKKVTRNGSSGNDPWTYNSDNKPVSIPNVELDNFIAFINLCYIRGDGYSNITYDTYKNLINLFMVWAGTRKITDICGKGLFSNYNYFYALTNARRYNDTTVSEVSEGVISGNIRGNIIWGIVNLYGLSSHIVENIGFYWSTFDLFLEAKRKINTNRPKAHKYSAICIKRNNGNNSVLYHNLILYDYSGTKTDIKKVVFGKYCDVILSRKSMVNIITNNVGVNGPDPNEYAKGYLYYQYTSVITKRRSYAFDQSGFLTLGGNNPIDYIMHDPEGTTAEGYITARLCYQGDIIINNN